VVIIQPYLTCHVFRFPSFSLFYTSLPSHHFSSLLTFLTLIHPAPPNPVNSRQLERFRNGSTSIALITSIFISLPFPSSLIHILEPPSDLRQSSTAMETRPPTPNPDDEESVNGSLPRTPVISTPTFNKSQTPLGMRPSPVSSFHVWMETTNSVGPQEFSSCHQIIIGTPDSTKEIHPSGSSRPQ
jgi:hypothetical protein